MSRIVEDLIWKSYEPGKRQLGPLPALTDEMITACVQPYDARAFVQRQAWRLFCLKCVIKHTIRALFRRGPVYAFAVLRSEMSTFG